MNPKTGKIERVMGTTSKEEVFYRQAHCENCGRMRVENDGTCEKCCWNNDTHEYVQRKSSIDLDEFWNEHFKISRSK